MVNIDCYRNDIYDNTMCNDFDSCASIKTDNEMALCVSSKFCKIFPDVSPKLTLLDKEVVELKCPEIKLTPEEQLEANALEAAKALAEALAERMKQEDFPLFYEMIKETPPKTELLDLASLLAGLQATRPALTEAYVKPLFEKADTEQPIGKLDFTEFKAVVAADKAALKLAEDLKDPVYQAYDALVRDPLTGEAKKLTFDVFKAAALVTDPAANEETLKKLYDASDDGDGELTFAEYKVLQEKIKE
jgi:hypothetical protein